MSKRKSPKKSRASARESQQHRQSTAEKPAAGHFLARPAVRETIESIAIAFILAFLFRTFEAEAFVIPTGSMATTLMGRHKDLVCPMCGYPYQVSASNEVDKNGVPYGPGTKIAGCTCPMCRYTMDLDRNNPHGRKYKSYNGDRILVDKFSYQFTDPERWDVAVFKYPGGAMTNYIKRLVGLPGETIRISHGDIFVRPDGEDEFTIARKPSKKLLAMLHPVFDNDVTPKILQRGWAPRWRPVPSADGSTAGEWEPLDEFSSFQTTGQAQGEAWLRYEHRVPSYRQWLEREEGIPPSDEPRPQLISDFCAYNTGRASSDSAPAPDAFGLHWVGDLALKCTLEAETDSGEAIFELVEGGRRFQCRIDLATGTAALSIVGLDSYRPTAETKIHGGGKCKILFANVDDQLRLWIDGREVQFDAPTTYAPLGNTRPTTADLLPVGVGTNGAGLRVSHLEILRDIYYIADGHSKIRRRIITDFKQIYPHDNVLADPALWDAFDEENIKKVDFVLEPDRFLALGDNSAKSKDGRLWEQDNFEYYVSRELLIGKALFIYWPHSWNRLPGTNIPLPFFPNFQRMGFVR